MFGIGFSEILVIAVVAIVFVGPKRLPEVMKQIGRFFVHARRMSNEVRSTFDTVIHQAEQEIHLENLKKLREMTAESLIKPMLGDQPRIPHPDDYPHHHDDHQHHGEQPVVELGKTAETVPGSQAVAVVKPDAATAIEKPDFDNHGKV
jgi:Tat protein translocase TatB subunit